MERWRLSVPGASGPPTTISHACLRKPRQIADLRLYLDLPPAPMRLGIGRRGYAGRMDDLRYAMRSRQGVSTGKQRTLAHPPAISSGGFRQRVPSGSNRVRFAAAQTQQDHCSIFASCPGGAVSSQRRCNECLPLWTGAGKNRSLHLNRTVFRTRAAMH